MFVEFDDVIFATRALQDMYGNTIGGLVKGGIRLSYSKVRLTLSFYPSQHSEALLKLILLASITLGLHRIHSVSERECRQVLDHRD